MKRDAQEAEREAFLGTLAAGLAHELRTPLSTLKINVSLLEEEWQQAVTEKEKRCARRLRAVALEIDKLQDVLNAFIRFAARHELKREPTDLHALLSDVVEFVSARAAQAKINVAAKFCDGMPRLMLDAALVRQAFLNVIVNALEAVGGPGNVWVETRRDGENAVVEISDDGPGIARAARDKIFNLYFSTKPGGTGFGLATSKRFIEEHGGAISFHDRPGGGVAFVISLPVEAP